MIKNVVIRRLGLALLALLTFVPAVLRTGAQASSQVSLAYVDSAGNVFLMPPGATQATALTTDADFKPQSATPPTHNYTHLRWSPDGTKLAFEDTVAGNLYVAASGSAYRLLASGVAAEYPPAWLPDSSAVAYVVNTQQPAGGTAMTMGIQQIAIDTGQSKAIGTFVETQGCGGGSGDPASILYAQETGLNGNPLTLAWTKSGWLYSTACTGIGLALNNSSNQQQWKVDNVGRIAVATSGSQAAGVLFDQNSKPSSLVYIDLATGRYGALSTGPGVDQVGWSADETLILYSTLDGQGVSLWKIPVQGAQATLLFSDPGRYIGVITSSADSQSAVFSYIPDGDNPQIQILSTPINGGPTNRTTATAIAQGGRPAEALTPSVAANVTPSPTAEACTPRSDWAFTYTVVPGDTVASLARRTGTTVDMLATGNCLANANLIYVGQVLRVPVSPQPLPATAKRIVFPAGATTVAVQGRIAANGIDRWVLRALGGQTLSAQLAFSAGQGVLVVWGANGSVLQSDRAGASAFNGVLPTTQDYFIDVRGSSSVPTSYTLTITVPPLSASQFTTRRIQFPPGATTVSVQGQLAASGMDRWVLRALGGQTLSAQLTFTFGQAILIVFGADGNVLQSDHAGSSSFTGVLPTTQDYIIDVRGNPNGPTNYTLTITVPPLSAPQFTTRRIVFPVGATTVSVQGQLAASGMDRWVLRALGGQTLTAQLTFSFGQAILIVWGADGNVLQSDHAGSSSFTGVLPTTQDYYIDVRGNPNGPTSYTLIITVPPL